MLDIALQRLSPCAYHRSFVVARKASIGAIQGSASSSLPRAFTRAFS
jgi:hypothetical protein